MSDSIWRKRKSTKSNRHQKKTFNEIFRDIAMVPKKLSEYVIDAFFFKSLTASFIQLYHFVS